MSNVLASPATFLATVLLLSYALPADAAQNAPHHRALGPLQGRWYSRSTESDGTQQTGEEKANLHVIKGDEVVATVNGTVISKAKIKKLEPGKEFGRITLRMTEGNDRGKTWVAIYQVTENSLRWCGSWSGENDKLPSGFVTTAGDHYFVRTMQREKR